MTSSVGDYLREIRERRGLSLDEIARVTRVAGRYLEALEANRFSALPAPVFTRGFVRAYCQALGESPDEALARYDAREGAVVAKPVPPLAPSPRASESEPRSRSAVLVSFVLLVVLGMALVAVALMTQPAREERRASPLPDEARRPLPPPTPAVTPAATPPVTSPSPSPSTTATPPRAPAAPVPAAASSPTPPATSTPPAADAVRQTPPPAPLPDIQGATDGLTSPYRLVARVSEPTWIRVRMEDGTSTEETMPPGAIREWVSNRPFVLTIGNAGGVLLELNGRALPPLGARGAVITRLVLPAH